MLKKQGVRGNVGFDILYKNDNGDIRVFILESNGIHRPTGSTLPNCFCYNTKNNYFIGIPIIPKYLKDTYLPLSTSNLLDLGKMFMNLGTNPGQPQIMNIKTEGIEYGYPVLWIAGSGPNMSDIEKLYIETDFLNEKGKTYVAKIVNDMKTIHN